MQGHALVLQRPYTISDRINLVVDEEMQNKLTTKIVEVYVLVLCIWSFFPVFTLVLKEDCTMRYCKIVNCCHALL